jgi:hypothetical protein
MINIKNLLVNIFCKILEDLYLILGELLLDWFLLQFEGRENLTLIKQIIFKCLTCLISIGVLREENNQNNDLFQV